MVTPISGISFISDSILFVRDVLRSNIVDPISRSGSGTSFIFTSYPRTNVRYPIITVRQEGNPHIRRIGMGSTGTVTQIPAQIRIWARNEKEKDNLTQNVYNYLKSIQYGTGSTFEAVGLHDLDCTSSVNIDEPGEEGIKSKSMMFNWKYINY